MANRRIMIYAIIGLAVVAAAGLGVGIYFAVKPSPKTLKVESISPSATKLPTDSIIVVREEPMVVVPDLYNQLGVDLYDRLGGGPDQVRRTVNVEPYDDLRWPRSAIYYDQRLPPMIDRFNLIDGPTERVLRRPKDPVGPWERVGALYQQQNTTVTSMLPLFARQRGTNRNRYDYRTVYDEVPVPIAENIQWITKNQPVVVEPLGTFSVIMYDDYV